MYDSALSASREDPIQINEIRLYAMYELIKHLDRANNKIKVSANAQPKDVTLKALNLANS